MVMDIRVKKRKKFSLENSRHFLRALLLELSHLVFCERLNNAVVNVLTWPGILN